MESEIKIAMVGFGGMGQHMLKLATGCFENVRAVGICEVNPEALAKARALFSIPKNYTVSTTGSSCQ